VQVGPDDLGALGQQAGGNRAPDAGRGAGHHRDFSGKPVGYLHFLGLR